MLRKGSIRRIYALGAQKRRDYVKLHAEMEDRVGVFGLRTATPSLANIKQYE